MHDDAARRVREGGVDVVRKGGGAGTTRVQRTDQPLPLPSRCT